MKINLRLARIKNQELGEMNGGTDSYSGWIDARMPRDENGDATEPVQANPDSLAEGTSYFGPAEVTTPQRLIGEAVEHLQGRQKQVYLLMMRLGYSCAQAGKELGISKWTARDYKDRAVKFIAQYCKQQMAKQ